MPVPRVKKLEYNVLTSQSPMDSKTYHGISIFRSGPDGRARRSAPIGRISSWAPTARTRTITPVRELSAETFGKVIEQVPGIAEGWTVSCTRVEVWGDETERALGFDDVFADLTDQNHPFQVKEELRRGNAVYMTWTYEGCWFSSLGEEGYDAAGDAVVKVSSELTYTYRTFTRSWG